MKAAVVRGVGQIEIQDILMPKFGPYQALVKVLACGFCNGTDTKIVEGHWGGLSPFPYILGHETVGEVVECGKKVRYLKPHDHVLQVRVEEYPELGLGTAWGGFVEFAVATDWEAMKEDHLPLPNSFFVTQQKVPLDMHPFDAVMSITLKEVYSALQHFGLKPGSSVLIFGDGPVGISMASCAKLLGADPVIVCGHHDERLKIANKMGATHTINSREANFMKRISEICPGGIELIVDAIGNNDLIQSSMDLISDSGKIGVYGFSGQQEMVLNWRKAPSRWSLDYLIVPQLDLLVAAHEPVVKAIQTGSLCPREIVSDIFTLDNIHAAYEATKNRKALKAVVDMCNANG